jgi:hypothetical protein
LAHGRRSGRLDTLLGFYDSDIESHPVDHQRRVPGRHGCTGKHQRLDLLLSGTRRHGRISDSDADEYADADIHEHPDVHEYAYTYAYVYVYVYANEHEYADRHPDGDAYAVQR